MALGIAGAAILVLVAVGLFGLASGWFRSEAPQQQAQNREPELGPADTGKPKSTDEPKKEEPKPAADPNVLERTGRVLVVAEVAEEYGFTDVDGATPQSLRGHYEPRK